MEGRSDVVIVSAFERGFWLARKLKQQGLSVTLVDVTSQLGLVTVSDYEGPLGVWAEPGFDSSHLEFLSTAEMEDIPQGFSVWAGSEAPIEFRGPTRSHRLVSMGLSLPIFESFSDGAESCVVPNTDFYETWLYALGHDLGSTQIDPFRLKKFSDRPLPWMSPYFSRRHHSETPFLADARKGLEKLESENIHVIMAAQIIDLSMTGRVMDGVEVRAERSGIVTGRQFVWMLTSHETRHCLPQAWEGVFPRGVLDPQWMWSVFGVEIGLNEFSRELPGRFCLIDELEAPWTHGNLLLCQRNSQNETQETSKWSVWLRRPMNQRFQKSYIENLAREIERILSRRLVNARVHVRRQPLESEHDEPHLGPVRFPIFDPEEKSRFHPVDLKNLYFETAEQWESWDWGSQFRSQQKTCDAIQKWWKKEQLKRGEQRDRAISTT